MSAYSLYLISSAEVRSLWAQLRRDEPYLLSNFEDFLARVTSQIKEANQERREMESALKRSERAFRLSVNVEGSEIIWCLFHICKHAVSM